MQSQRVFRVVDGDTVVLIRGGEKVTCRLIGCNAPETKHPGQPVGFYGPESAAYLKGWLEGKTVRVSYQTQPFRRDRYGRPLVYLWAAYGTQLVNLEMVARGFARFDPGYPAMYKQHFAEAELEARRKGLGLWSGKQSYPFSGLTGAAYGG
jgi:micrococcal nuclease